MSPLATRDVVYKPHNEIYEIRAKQYVHHNITIPHDRGGLTLILLHGMGASKEVWEPTIEHWFSPESELRNVAEVWSLENPDHGQSAVANERVLDSMPCTATSYADAVYLFLRDGMQHGAQTDFSQRALVGVGHSFGGVALLTLAGKVRETKELAFRYLILVEASISEDSPARRDMARRAISALWTKSDTWLSLEAAKKNLFGQPWTSRWTEESVDIFLRYSLRPHPDACQPEPYKFEGVELSFTKKREAAYWQAPEISGSALAEVTRVCREMPVLLLFGSINDFAPRKVRSSQVERAQNGHPPQEIANAGHMIPQEQPKALASAIATFLLQRSRL